MAVRRMTQMQISVPETMLEKIDAEAERINCTRASAIRMLVSDGLQVRNSRATLLTQDRPVYNVDQEKTTSA